MESLRKISANISFGLWLQHLSKLKLNLSNAGSFARRKDYPPHSYTSVANGRFRSKADIRALVPEWVESGRFLFI